MRISIDEVTYVANLARLELGSEEVVEMAGQLDRILTYIDKLNELDTTGLVPTTHAISIENAFREDEVAESLSQERSLANGPRHGEDSFIVPRVI